MKHKINLNLSSNQDILNTLDYLIEHYDEIANDAYENSGIEFYDSSTGDLLELEAPIHPAIEITSELTFYLRVVENKDNFDKLEKYIQVVIEKNSPKSVWMNDEIQMGLNAAFALAFRDKKYIYDFVNVLRTFDLNNEVYEPFFIDLLLDKWMICDEVLFLLAARSGSISGQWGLEELEIPTLNSDHKNKFLTYLLEDALKSKTVFSENLLDSMELLDIVVDPEKFSNLFEHDKPLFQKDNIPSIHHIQ